MKIQFQNSIKKKGAVPEEGRAPVDRADIALCAASVLVPVAQHLVGKNPEEREDVVVARRQFDGELTLILCGVIFLKIGLLGSGPMLFT